MVYSEIEKIKSIKKGTNFSFFRVAVIFLLAIAVIIVVLSRERSKQTGDIKKERAARELADEEKIQILESLSASSDVPKYTDEEKRRILDSLSASSDQPVLSEEEKKKILDSLSAPQE